MNGIRIFHSAHGWIAETPIGLSISELEAAIKFHKSVMQSRMSQWSKDKQDKLQITLAQLNAHTIRQSIIPRYPWEQDRILV